MDVQELLQRSMTEHAGDVRGGADPSLATSARREAQAIRVRRGAGALVAVAAVAALVGMAGTDVLRADPEPEPADAPTRAVDVADAFAGRSLITSAETHDGAALEMTVDAGDTGSQWLVSCVASGPEYVVHRTIDGASEDTAVCSPLEVLGDTMSFRWTAAEPAGDGRVLRLWITRDGAVVEPDGVILAAAAYALPAPLLTLAGADVQEIEPFVDREWAYLDSAESEPGERSLTHRFDAQVDTALLEITSEGTGQGTVQLLVDGVVVQDPSAYALNSTDLGAHVSPGEPHTVTVKILGDVPPDARLAIVRRLPTDHD